MSYHIGTATISMSLNWWNTLPSFSILFYWFKMLSFNYLSRISSFLQFVAVGTDWLPRWTPSRQYSQLISNYAWYLDSCNIHLQSVTYWLPYHTWFHRVHILLIGFKMSKPHLGWWLCITIVFLDTLQDRYLHHTLFSEVLILINHTTLLSGHPLLTQFSGRG